ncbi:virulence factor TspB C-terminal domain-related protein, partial [Acidithiobacillus ferrianus]|uniref:virulence factor TspB C-terminal domain-related protein n=1 Tax=Acidithiobacillus ferrianus TaxID=2678518 RepID=UPI0034E451A9
SICVSQADINSGFSASSTVVDSLSSSSCTVTFDGSVTYTVSFISCSEDCIPYSGEAIGTIGSSATPNSNGVLPHTYCSPTTYCDTESFSSSAGPGGNMTNGKACFPSLPTSSTTSSSSSCPSGYSPADSSGCVCSNGSGSFVNANGSDTNPVCNGGSPTAPVLSPVSPVTSNGQSSCPTGPGTAQISNGSSTSCYVVKVPPAVNNGSTPGGSPGGGGGGSSYHLSAPTKSSNGQLTCPPGASSIGNGNSLECIVSGPAPLSAPTGSGSSGTSPTGSTASGNNYPTSFSMPTMPTESVTTIALGQIASAQESTSQQCPSPVTFDVMSHTFSISFTYACQLAAQVRPVVIGVFSMASLLLIVK